MSAGGTGCKHDDDGAHVKGRRNGVMVVAVVYEDWLLEKGIEVGFADRRLTDLADKENRGGGGLQDECESI